MIAVIRAYIGPLSTWELFAFILCVARAGPPACFPRSAIKHRASCVVSLESCLKFHTSNMCGLRHSSLVPFQRILKTKDKTFPIKPELPLICISSSFRCAKSQCFNG